MFFFIALELWPTLFNQEVLFFNSTLVVLLQQWKLTATFATHINVELEKSTEKWPCYDRLPHSAGAVCWFDA